MQQLDCPTDSMEFDSRWYTSCFCPLIISPNIVAEATLDLCPSGNQLLFRLPNVNPRTAFLFLLLGS